MGFTPFPHAAPFFISGTVVCAPLFVWLISAKGKSILQKLNGLAKGKFIYLFIMPST